MQIPEATIIDRMYADHRALLETLRLHREISLASDADNYLKKILLLSTASYFESEIQRELIDFAGRASANNVQLIALVKAKAVSRQYHTYFKWDGKNANTFFALFGEEFATACKEKVRADSGLDAAVRAFLEIGNTRNEMVHENFALFSMEKTAEEVFSLYEKARLFVEFVANTLKNVPWPAPRSGSSS